MRPNSVLFEFAASAALRRTWHAPRRLNTSLALLISEFVLCTRVHRVAQRARRVLRLSLRFLGRVRLRIYKYTYSLFCVLVSLFHLILTNKLFPSALHFSLSLCTSGDRKGYSQSFIKKTEQEVECNVEVALHSYNVFSK